MAVDPAPLQVLAVSPPLRYSRRVMIPCERQECVLSGSAAGRPALFVGFAATHHILLAGLPAHSFALRPAHSRRHQFVTCYTEGFSHFVTSMTAPVASGWSGRRVGLAPTGKRRLLTAHTLSGHSRSSCAILRGEASRAINLAGIDPVSYYKSHPLAGLPHRGRRQSFERGHRGRNGAGHACFQKPWRRPPVCKSSRERGFHLQRQGAYWPLRFTVRRACKSQADCAKTRGSRS